MVEIGAIEPLDGIDAVRKRPGMFVGDLNDGTGLHHMLWEVVANALDQHLGGHARRLDVRLQGHEVTVSDDGRGIPIHQRQDGRTYLETVLTTLHTGGTEDDHFPHVHVTVAMHGVGLAPVCALSERLSVDVKRENVHYRQTFTRGRPAGSLEHLGSCIESGTSITFVPDAEVFPSRDFDVQLVGRRLQELAFLNPDLQLTLQDQLLDGGDGLGTYCIHLCGDRELVASHPLRLRRRHKKVDVDVAIGWASTGDAQVRSFVSQSRTHDGGSHERGFWEGVRRAFKELDTKGVIGGMPTDEFRRAVSEGLVAVVHAGLYDPHFDSPTRSSLHNPEARSAVAQIVHEGLVVYLSQYHRLRELLFQRLRGS